MKPFFVQLLLIAAASALSTFDVLYQEWKVFKLQHKKAYENKAEEIYRMKIFIENKNKIARHNQRFERGEVTYRLAINEYSDMSHQEILDNMNGYKKYVRDSKLQYAESFPATFISPDSSVLELPKAWDWRMKGAVTEVKNQGNKCNSCWAFSTTGALEGQHFRETDQLVSLSEQNLIDCMNYGCNKGSVAGAYEYINNVGGIDNGKRYPYVAEKGVCMSDISQLAAEIVGYSEIPEGDEKLLKIAVATVGPISIAIDTNDDSFSSYSTGVYKNVTCSPHNINHAMLLVGYGTDEKYGDYWLVKNSWGKTWGEEGYLKIARTGDNYCGIASSAFYPIV